jgi:hypothetical protein
MVWVRIFAARAAYCLPGTFSNGTFSNKENDKRLGTCAMFSGGRVPRFSRSFREVLTRDKDFREFAAAASI